MSGSAKLLQRFVTARTTTRLSSTTPRTNLPWALPPRPEPRAPSTLATGALRYGSTTGAAGGANDYQFGPVNDVQPQPSTQSVGLPPGNEQKRRCPNKEEPTVNGNNKRRTSGGSDGGGTHDVPGTAWKMFEVAATTAASLAILGLAGYGYHRYYKYLVLKKIDNAFNAGDPALKLAGATHQPWIQLDELDRIDGIITGKEHGHYYLLIGEKGTGKTSMILRAMHQIQGEGCSMMEAHADPEIFRIRLGKALDFEFHEDYIGSLFSIHGPRETTALLDIERGLNKLEKVAIERRKEGRTPLVMIINGTHMIRDDEVGRDLLELLQQRAESWAAAGLVTMVFNSDDYWVYERLKQYGSRLETIRVKDLRKSTAVKSLKRLRTRICEHRGWQCKDTDEDYEKAYSLIGGRLAFLTKVAKARNMLDKCHEICQTEKTWLLNKCWILGEGMDDDVMDQQKFASSAMLLVQHLVDMDNEMRNAPDWDEDEEHQLPEISLHKARQVMTRADFIQQYDHDNIFTIDSTAKVRADSVPMMHAFREVANEEGFREWLDDTMERIGDIESLGRTREVSLKDLWNGGKYEIVVKDHKDRLVNKTVWETKRGRKAVHGNDGSDEEVAAAEAEED